MIDVSASDIVARVQKLGSPEKARLLQRYFKTGPGEYAEGDVFAGVAVPHIRRLAREHCLLPERELLELLRSPLHEARLLALLLLVGRFQKGDSAQRARVYKIYLGNTTHIDNWDLVDASAAKIVGAYLEHRDRAPLFSLAGSENIWERRIAVIAILHFIRAGDFEDALGIARLLISDSEDLIRKAVGWMLREIGKRDRTVEEEFLRPHYKTMPRIMLRYAVERFPEPLRQRYLQGRI